MKTAHFRDKVKIYVTAGNGGDGAATFRREKYVPRGGPDGGDGGRGGHVYLVADENEDSLLDLAYHPHQRAKHGGRGGKKDCHGKNGTDLYIKVPPGTTVRELEPETVLGEVLNHGDSLLVASGGKGGLGNTHFVSSVNQAPRRYTEGEQGEEKTLRLELKLVADVGLVGYPNAGKSTLVSAITGAHPKVAAYPFTTLNPIIGTLRFEDYATLRIADIPGLIDGAHQGVGLGHAFLRHIERTDFLLFVIDMAGVDGRDPLEDFYRLREELRLYSETLETRPYAVVANKMDLPETEQALVKFRKKTGEKPLRLSAQQGDGLDELKDLLYKRVVETAKEREEPTEDRPLKAET